MSINLTASSGKFAQKYDSVDDLFVIGESVMIRTLKYHFVGTIVGIRSIGECHFLIMKDACYVAVTDRFLDGLKNGTIKEGEPIPGVHRVQISHINDVCEWNHAPISKQV